MVISGHQGPSVAISGHQGPSVLIRDLFDGREWLRLGGERLAEQRHELLRVRVPVGKGGGGRRAVLSTCMRARREARARFQIRGGTYMMQFENWRKKVLDGWSGMSTCRCNARSDEITRNRVAIRDEQR